jgi:hypothetical protein
MENDGHAHLPSSKNPEIEGIVGIATSMPLPQSGHSTICEDYYSKLKAIEGKMPNLANLANWAKNSGFAFSARMPDLL